MNNSILNVMDMYIKNHPYINIFLFILFSVISTWERNKMGITLVNRKCGLKDFKNDLKNE